MIDYPVTFPCASRVEGHGATLFTGTIRTPMEAGNSRQRRSHHALPHQISLVFVIKQTAYHEWLKWCNLHAWDEWVSMNLPGLAASEAGTDVAPILVRFCTDIRAELMPVFRLWYWRVSVDCEYIPDPELLAAPPPPLQLTAQWNPSDQGRANRTMTFTNDHRIAIRSAPVTSNGGSVRAVKSNGGSGKFYVELDVNALVVSGAFWSFGLMSAGISQDADPANEATVGWVLIYGNGAVYYDAPGGGASPASLGSMTGGSLVDGDKIGLAWTVGTGLDIYKNGVLNKTVAYTSTAQHFPWFGQGNTNVGGTNNTPGATCTLRAITADFTYPLPATFSPWAADELTYVAPLSWNPEDLSQSVAGTLTFVELDKRIEKAAGAATVVLRAIAAAAKSSGKWYFEIEVVTTPASQFAVAAGVCKLDAVLTSRWDTLPAASAMLQFGDGGMKAPGGTVNLGGKSWGAVANTILGIAFEPGVGFVTNQAGGTVGASMTLPAGNYVPCVAFGVNYSAALADSTGIGVRIRTGTDLHYAPPAGYTALAY